MTKEEILQRIEWYNQFIMILDTTDIEKLITQIAYLEKQLQQLNVKVYEPMYLKKGTIIDNKASYYTDYGITTDMVERHNAGEELKKLISEENQKQGWKVDWEDITQIKVCIKCYNHRSKEIDLDWYGVSQTSENELYFSDKSAGNKDFLAKIKPLWKRGKGIE